MFKPEERLVVPMKKKGKQNSGKSSASGNQAGTSKDALEQMYQTPLSKESAKVSLGSQSKMASYSKEMFSTWRDIRWYQVPLSSLRRPKARLFSFTFQSSLQKYQQLRKIKQLKVGRPFSVLPLPNLSLSFTDPAPFQDTLQHDNHGSSRAGGSKGNKRLSAHTNESQAFLRRMQKKLQRRQPSANLLHPKCNSSAGISGQQWETGLCRSSRKKSKQGDSAPLAETLEGGDSSSLWSNPNSPLEEEKEDEEMFPPDWTPPRTAFLYNEDPPPLSPASGPIPEFQSSGEMPDITEEPGGSSRMELRVKALSPVGSPVFVLKDSGAMQLKEFGKRHVDNPECSTFDVCQAADEELEELVLEDQREVSNQGVLEQEECSLLQSPVFSSGSPSTECFKSSISVSLDGFSGGPERLACELDVEGDSGTEGSSSSLPVHLLLPRSGISSRSSISASSDELSGDARGVTQGSVMEEDMDDSSLVPVRDLLQMDDSSSSSVELSSCPLPGPDSYLSSLDKLLEEKREQIREDRELDGSLGTKLLSSSWLSAGDASEENEAPLSDAQRLVLEQFSISPGTIPTVHPGENIFRPPSYRRTALVLDTAGLTPQNPSESLLFSSAHQMAILHSGCLGSIYHGTAKCPLSVLHWLFQLMSLNPDVSADAFQALWEISAYQNIASDKVSTDLWCPELKDVTQAFYNFGACASALFPAGLVQHEFMSGILKFPEYPLHTADIKNEVFPEEAHFQLSLVTMLGDTFKFLTLCVTSHPHCYPDCQCLALLTLLCRVSLDKNLRKQPLMDLQQLLLVLLEGIQGWQEKLPELCRSLCHVSQHHHNLVAVVRLFPDATTRGRQLRRSLSLYFIMKLLGKMQMVPNSWQEEIQLQQLCDLLPLMKPACLKQALQKTQKLQEEPAKDQRETPTDLDHEAYYLCYNLLVLANVVVGTEPVSPREQGHLRQLCTQLQWHVSSSIREDPCLMYRTKLKNLAAQTYIKWQELLSWGWLQLTP